MVNKQETRRLYMQYLKKYIDEVEKDTKDAVLESQPITELEKDVKNATSENLSVTTIPSEKHFFPLTEIQRKERITKICDFLKLFPSGEYVECSKIAKILNITSHTTYKWMERQLDKTDCPWEQGTSVKMTYRLKVDQQPKELNPIAEEKYDLKLFSILNDQFLNNTRKYKMKRKPHSSLDDSKHQDRVEKICHFLEQIPKGKYISCSNMKKILNIAPINISNWMQRYLPQADCPWEQDPLHKRNYRLKQNQ